MQQHNVRSTLTVWKQVKGSPPAQQSLRGRTIVVGPSASNPVHPVFVPILRAIGPKVPYLGEDLELEGEEPEREPTLAQEEADAEYRAELRGER